jgi:hypothetical protein
MQSTWRMPAARFRLSIGIESSQSAAGAPARHFDWQVQPPKHRAPLLKRPQASRISRAGAAHGDAARSGECPDRPGISGCRRRGWQTTTRRPARVEERCPSFRRFSPATQRDTPETGRYGQIHTAREKRRSHGTRRGGDDDNVHAFSAAGRAWETASAGNCGARDELTDESPRDRALLNASSRAEREVKTAFIPC